MLRNYVILTVRNIRRHKGHTFINVTGLAVGMATCIMIMLWVADELRFDRFHQDADHIYRLCHELTLGGSTRDIATGSDPMAPVIQAACPEVAAITRIKSGSRTEIVYGNNRFFEENILYADSQFFSVFTFPLIQGDPRTALARAHSVVITQDIARKYFGDQDPLGKTLRSWGSEYTVTGVIEKIPSNSHFSFDFLRSYRSIYNNEGNDWWRWANLDVFTYMRAAPNAVVEGLESKVASVIYENMGKNIEKRKGNSLRAYLQPLTKIHLYSDYQEEISTGRGSISYVLLFSAIGIGVLLIACANFVNLTTAGSAHRVKEVGVRKTFGADHGKLTSQFLMESILLSLVALVVALILIELAMPSFNTMTQRDLSLEFLGQPWILPGLVLFAIFVGFLAGIYPALSLSSMKPAAGLKGLHRSTESRSMLRRVLVVGQYGISIALIIGTAMIYNQVSYMKNKNLGFAKDQLLVIRGVADLRQAASTATTLKSEIAQSPGVIQASLSWPVPGESVLMENFRPEGPNAEEMLMVKMFADESYLPTLGLELIAGRNFSRQMGSDSVDALLINEAAARKLGWEDAVGKTVEVPKTNGPDRQPRKVIGVVKDFHYMGLSQPIEPVAIIWNPAALPGYLSVRIGTSDVSHTLDKIRDLWNRLSGEAPFDYFFVDERFAEQYKAEERLGKIVVVFSLLAIFVACLGLFGMASHEARRRTKEIGVRKVLGATVHGVAAILATDMVKWVLVANVIAWPIAYYVMNRWLQTFAYRIAIGPSVFILSGVLALAVAVVTVGYHAVRAARANPVESLKYE